LTGVAAADDLSVEFVADCLSKLVVVAQLCCLERDSLRAETRLVRRQLRRYQVGTIWLGHDTRF
jgi:hypothetical protein